MICNSLHNGAKPGMCLTMPYEASLTELMLGEAG